MPCIISKFTITIITKKQLKQYDNIEEKDNDIKKSLKQTTTIILVMADNFCGFSCSITRGSQIFSSYSYPLTLGCNVVISTIAKREREREHLQTHKQNKKLNSICKFPGGSFLLVNKK